jgi:putative acetyltransferase
MIQLLRTDSEHPEFLPLVRQLDQYLAGVNGEENDFFAQYNKIDYLKNVVLAFDGNEVVGCGAMKEWESNSMEIKRMFVPSIHRGKGIATLILKELESWAKELGYQQTVLETSKSMEDAVGLYTKTGYQVIPNYGPYEKVETSICFEKILN